MMLENLDEVESMRCVFPSKANYLPHAMEYVEQVSVQILSMA